MMQALWIVLVCSAVTLFLRALPFVFFSGKGGVPPRIERLGRALPPAIMAALVVYCLKGVPYGSFADGAYQLIAGAVVVLVFPSVVTVSPLPPPQDASAETSITASIKMAMIFFIAFSF